MNAYAVCILYRGALQFTVSFSDVIFDDFGFGSNVLCYTALHLSHETYKKRFFLYNIQRTTIEMVITFTCQKIVWSLKRNNQVLLPRRLYNGKKEIIMIKTCFFIQSNGNGSGSGSSSRIVITGVADVSMRSSK